MSQFPHLKTQIMKKAEAEGHFRNLVSYEAVESAPFAYNLRKQHPQWIIGKGRQ
jgi:hypothetical protein